MLEYQRITITIEKITYKPMLSAYEIFKKHYADEVYILHKNGVQAGIVAVKCDKILAYYEAHYAGYNTLMPTWYEENYALKGENIDTLFAPQQKWERV